MREASAGVRTEFSIGVGMPKSSSTFSVSLLSGFKNGRGPFGFKPDDLKNALSRVVDSAKPKAQLQSSLYE